MNTDTTISERSQSSAPSHTPGPWRADERAPVSGVPSEQSKIPFAITRPDTGYCTPIADVCAFPPSTHTQVEIMRANANLIAAAPLLLEACKELLGSSVYADAEGSVSVEHGGWDDEEHRKIVDRVKAAINAAQGNSGSGDLK